MMYTIGVLFLDSYSYLIYNRVIQSMATKC